MHLKSNEELLELASTIKKKSASAELHDTVAELTKRRDQLNGQQLALTAVSAFRCAPKDLLHLHRLFPMCVKKFDEMDTSGAVDVIHSGLKFGAVNNEFNNKLIDRLLTVPYTCRDLNYILATSAMAFGRMKLPLDPIYQRRMLLAFYRIIALTEFCIRPKGNSVNMSPPTFECRRWDRLAVSHGLSGFAKLKDSREGFDMIYATKLDLQSIFHADDAPSFEDFIYRYDESKSLLQNTAARLCRVGIAIQTPETDNHSRSRENIIELNTTILSSMSKLGVADNASLKILSDTVLAHRTSWDSRTAHQLLSILSSLSKPVLGIFDTSASESAAALGDLISDEVYASCVSNVLDHGATDTQAMTLLNNVSTDRFSLSLPHTRAVLRALINKAMYRKFHGSVGLQDSAGVFDVSSTLPCLEQSWNTNEHRKLLVELQNAIFNRYNPRQIVQISDNLLNHQSFIPLMSTCIGVASIRPGFITQEANCTIITRSLHNMLTLPLMDWEIPKSLARLEPMVSKEDGVLEGNSAETVTAADDLSINAEREPDVLSPPENSTPPLLTNTASEHSASQDDHDDEEFLPVVPLSPSTLFSQETRHKWLCEAMSRLIPHHSFALSTRSFYDLTMFRMAYAVGLWHGPCFQLPPNSYAANNSLWLPIHHTAHAGVPLAQISGSNKWLGQWALAHSPYHWTRHTGLDGMTIDNTINGIQTANKHVSWGSQDLFSRLPCVADQPLTEGEDVDSGANKLWKLLLEADKIRYFRSKSLTQLVSTSNEIPGLQSVKESINSTEKSNSSSDSLNSNNSSASSGLEFVDNLREKAFKAPLEPYVPIITEVTDNKGTIANSEMFFKLLNDRGAGGVINNNLSSNVHSSTPDVLEEKENQGGVGLTLYVDPVLPGGLRVDALLLSSNHRHTHLEVPAHQIMDISKLNYGHKDCSDVDKVQEKLISSTLPKIDSQKTDNNKVTSEKNVKKQKRKEKELLSTASLSSLTTSQPNSIPDSSFIQSIIISELDNMIASGQLSSILQAKISSSSKVDESKSLEVQNLLSSVNQKENIKKRSQFVPTSPSIPSSTHSHSNPSRIINADPFRENESRPNFVFKNKRDKFFLPKDKNDKRK